MVSPKQVGKAIIRLRKLRGLSQEKFALESGIDRRYLSDVENGKRNVSFELLNRVARFFNVSLSSFIKETEQSAFFNNIEELRAFLIERGSEKTVFFTNPDYLNAIVGITNDGCLVYSYAKMIDYLVLEKCLNYEEAVEFIEYNTIRTVPYMGDGAPIIVFDITE